MARSVVADFFKPEVAIEHAFSKFTDKLIALQLALSGAAGSPITVGLPGELSMKGDRRIIPFYKRISSLVTQRDLASVSAPADLKLDGDNRGEIVMRRKVGPIAYSLDIFKQNGVTPASVSAEIGKQAGEEMMKDVQAGIFNAINGALGNTVGGVNHVLDQYEPYAATKSTTTVVNNTMSLGMINKAKAVLSDSMSELTTLVLRSESAKDLIDITIGTGYDSIAGHAAVRGIPRTVGMGDPVLMDLTESLSANPSGSRTGSGSGTGTASFNLLRAYLMGLDAIQITFPHELEMFDEQRLDAEAPYVRILGNYDWSVNITGMGYKAASTGNPTNTELGTASNWEDKTTAGSREVKIIVVEHNDAVNAT